MHLSCVLVLSVSGYPSACELTRLIQEQNLVDILHHLLIINTKNAFVPSLSLSYGLARLLKRTAIGQEHQNTQ